MTASLVTQSTFDFADGNAGHVCNLGSAPTIGQLDVLCVNSETTVSTPAGWLAAPTEVGGQGAYIFRRIASGGEASTVTITTAGNFDTVAQWSRWDNVNAADDAPKAVASSAGTSTPAVSSAVLAATDELVVAFGALHTFPGATPSAPSWSAGYTPLTSQFRNNVGGFVSYKLNAGTPAESPSVSWTDSAVDRYIFGITFTTFASATTGTGVFDITAPAAAVSIDAATEPVDADFSLTAPAATVSITATSPAPPIPPISPLRMNFGPILTALSECVCGALSDAEVPICACMITIGQVTGDRCDCGCRSGSGSGQMALWVASTYLSASFPTPAPPDRIDMGCGPAYLVANMVAEISRCTPTVADQAGNPPSIAALTAATLAQQTDATLVRQAIGCCLVSLKTERDIVRFSIGQQTTLEPQGNCAGSALAFQVALPACVCATG